MAQQTLEYHYFGDKEDVVELVRYLQTSAEFLQEDFIQTLTQQKNRLDQVIQMYTQNEHTDVTLESFKINPGGWDTMNGIPQGRRLDVSNISNIELGAQ